MFSRILDAIGKIKTYEKVCHTFSKQKMNESITHSGKLVVFVFLMVCMSLRRKPSVPTSNVGLQELHKESSS